MFYDSFSDYLYLNLVSAKFPNVQVGQSSDRQLDGFEDITEILGNDDDRLFRQNNGYLTADAKQLTAFNKRLVRPFLCLLYGFPRIFCSDLSEIKHYLYNIYVFYPIPIYSSTFGQMDMAPRDVPREENL